MNKIANVFVGVLLALNVGAIAQVLVRADAQPWVWINLLGCIVFGAWLFDIVFRGDK